MVTDTPERQPILLRSTSRQDFSCSFKSPANFSPPDSRGTEAANFLSSFVTGLIPLQPPRRVHLPALRTPAVPDVQAAVGPEAVASIATT